MNTGSHLIIKQGFWIKLKKNMWIYYIKGSFPCESGGSEL